jgi:hypothetical protein
MLGRVGVVVAVAGGVALAIHAGLYAKQVRQESECAAWREAQRTILRDAGFETRWDWHIPEWNGDNLETALHDPDMETLWKARNMLAFYPQMASVLLPALRDPTFIGLRNEGALDVDGRDTPWSGCQTHVSDDLFRRAGRASWLLKEATGRAAPTVRVQTDRVQLADLARDWERWFDDLDNGAVCSSL